jgi:outer membrane biosynthesis protein TonB
MTTTDLTKKQLATLLSALDDAPRSPANKGEALRAIGRSAQRFGLTTDDVLAAAPGLLDGRLGAADFRVELHDLGGGSPVPATDAPQGAPDAQDHPDASGDPVSEPTEPAQAVQEPETTAPSTEPAADAAPAAKPAKRKGKAATKATKAAKPAKPEKAAPAEKPTPRAGTKQAKMIELLRRPEGANVEQIAAATGWQHHTIRGAISGALKKKLGLTVEATRTREVGPNKSGARGSSTVYRIVG